MKLRLHQRLGQEKVLRMYSDSLRFPIWVEGRERKWEERMKLRLHQRLGQEKVLRMYSDSLPFLIWADLTLSVPLCILWFQTRFSLRRPSRWGSFTLLNFKVKKSRSSLWLPVPTSFNVTICNFPSISSCGFPHSSISKNLPTMQTWVWFLGWEDSPGEGNGNPLQYSSLENPMNRGVWRATVHGFARVRHDLVTKPPPPDQSWFLSFSKFGCAKS